MRTLKIGMTGTDIMEVQAILQKLGYYKGAIDGIFGPNTERSVRAFQRNAKLIPDGIIGPATYEILDKYLLGYTFYTIKRGDTIYSISRKFNTKPAFIIAANPGISPNNLKVGETIVIPYGFNIVDTNIDYTYEILERDLVGLKKRYPFVEIGIIGVSSLGKNLYYIKLGNGPNHVFYNGAHHSLEWITSPLLMKFSEDFLKAYVENQIIRGFNPKNIWNSSSIYIVPMVNPDGVDLVLNGLSKDNPNYNNLIKWNNGSSNFNKVWQANNNGVDLNHNYNAGWEASKAAEAALGIIGPGPTRYSGPSPVSETETKSVVDFTNSHNFRLTLSYHSQGEVIYWNFMNLAPLEAKTIGMALAKDSGYILDEATGIASYAGYKDWFIKEFRKPGYTIEVGKGVNPLPISQFNKIYRDNLTMLLHASVI